MWIVVPLNSGEDAKLGPTCRISRCSIPQKRLREGLSSRRLINTYGLASACLEIPVKFSQIFNEVAWN